MNNGEAPSAAEIDRLYAALGADAEKAGYHLNPDAEFTRDLVEGLIKNEKRYGYRSCPCRLADGVRAKDLDIICPCDYRDQDLLDHDSCYCALYVTRKVLRGEKEAVSIPERRPPPMEREKAAVAKPAENPSGLRLPVWRCKVCGYLCAREEPPEVCPICKADKDRFERFL